MKFIKRVRPTKDGMTYDIDGGDPVLLFPLSTKLEKRFGLEPGQIPVFGLDGTYIQLFKGDIELTVGWDVWSDIFIMTFDEKGDELFKEIEVYLDSILDELPELQEKLLAEHKEKEEKEKSEENKE